MIKSYAVWADEGNPPVSLLNRTLLQFRCELAFVEALFDAVISLKSLSIRHLWEGFSFPWATGLLSVSLPPFFFFTKFFTLINASSAICTGSSICVMLRCLCIFLVLRLASFNSSSECPQWKAKIFLRFHLFTCSLDNWLTRSFDRSSSYSSRLISRLLE